MISIYCLVKDASLLDVAPSISAPEAVDYFLQNRYRYPDKAEVFCCRVSESAAADVKLAVSTPTSKGKVDGLTLLKRYSHSMAKYMDLT